MWLNQSIVIESARKFSGYNTNRLVGINWGNFARTHTIIRCNECYCKSKFNRKH